LVNSRTTTMGTKKMRRRVSEIGRFMSFRNQPLRGRNHMGPAVTRAESQKKECSSALSQL
jgi:hypothetical protein